MNKYSSRYMQNHCIDLFFNIDGFPIHVLTAGSTIPDSLNDILRNRTLQEEISRNSVEENSLNISINNDYVNRIINEHQNLIEEMCASMQMDDVENFFPKPDEDKITSHFKKYALQGFFSYDCSKVKEDGTAIYTLIAWPNRPLKLNYELPPYFPSHCQTQTRKVPPVSFGM